LFLFVKELVLFCVFSPELIVHPGQEMARIETVINRIDSLVIGPGLGRDSEKLVPLIKSLLNRAKQDEKLGVVIDAVSSS
jgi:NAD(P)H-hydrate repair Nnr-like enzyme with NAD(P)H-hydrate dehydratase domain